MLGSVDGDSDVLIIVIIDAGFCVCDFIYLILIVTEPGTEFVRNKSVYRRVFSELKLKIFRKEK